jgi:hypothetical protein
MGNPPDLYLLYVNPDNRILNIRTSENVVHPDFKFDAQVGSDCPFVFQITDQEGTFAASPVSWFNSNRDSIGQPAGVDDPEVSPDGKILTLIANFPAPGEPDQEHHFSFNFVGIDPIQNDPTIVEKPPEGTSSDDQK